MIPNKRSDQLTFNNFNTFKMVPEEDTMMLDYVDSALTAKLMSGLCHHRQPLGIIEECCYKPCSINTMREFCAKKLNMESAVRLSKGQK